MNELTTTNHKEEIKFMALGRVNGHYVNMRARYLDEIDRQREHLQLRSALMMLAGSVMTAVTVISVLYFLA